jgi:twitching motility protein PilT
MAADVRLLLKEMVDRGGSDLYVTSESPPVVRIEGVNHTLDGEPLTPTEVEGLANSLMTERQRALFEEEMEMNLGISSSKLGRFRVNVFRQRGAVGVVVRQIKTQIPSIDDLGLPAILKEIAVTKRGLVLVTGATGSGKSTTLAAMLDYINGQRTAHIVTIEDPIEYLHRDRKCIINQREVGFDTAAFGCALKGSLRQDPDVILVGEMRDLETTETALAAAETGHLVLSTMHTIDAPETITRIVAMFPPHQQRQIRLQLSGVLKGIVSQRLIPRASGKGRVAAVEVMVSTARVRDLIDDRDKTIQLRDTIAQGYTTYGMQTFDQALMDLVKREIITFEEALRQSSNPDDFKLKFSGISSTGDQGWQDISAEEEATDDDEEFKIDRV